MLTMRRNRRWSAPVVLVVLEPWQAQYHTHSPDLLPFAVECDVAAVAAAESVVAAVVEAVVAVAAVVGLERSG